MTEHFNRVQILTLSFKRNFHHVLNLVRSSGQLNNKVVVKSLYLELDPFKNQKPSKKLKANHDIEEAGFTTFKDDKQNGYHYYKDGLYVKYKKFDSKGFVYNIEYFNESRQMIRCEEFNEKGYLVRIKEIDPLLNKPTLYRYISKNGSCFLTTWLNPENGKIERSQLFYPKPIEFQNEVELYTHWVKQEVAHLANPVLMSDSRGLPSDQVVLNIPSHMAGKVAILHNNHFKKPYSKGSEFSPGWKTLLDNLGRFDRVVFLTEEQQQDFIEDIGEFDSYCVIPHEAKKLPENTSKINLDPHLAVAMVSLSNQKRVDEGIRAFVHVVEKIPDARFEVYGKGVLHDELQALIDELGLTDNVKLKGYTQDPTHYYRKAACMILSSDFEGSPLVFNEAMAAGTPIVTYDFKYGARDVIRDGVDGFIVPRGDQKALAEKIISIMQNPELREDLSKHAKEITERFSYEKYVNNWLTLFHEVGEGKNSTIRKPVSVFTRLASLIR